jgi:hypothetical protein
MIRYFVFCWFGLSILFLGTLCADDSSLDSLFAGDGASDSVTLEVNVVSEEQRKEAIKRNSYESIGRSGLEALGQSFLESLAESHAHEKEIAGDDYDRCQILLGQDREYRACIKDVSALNAMGESGLMAVYAINGQCNYLSGMETMGLSYLCKNPNLNGCSALSGVSQSVRNDCATCEGSNLWLRVFAASGTSLRCY